MQRLITETGTRGANALEKEWQGWLKLRPCAACHSRGPVDVHHCVGSTYSHNKQLIGHWFCLPLCRRCHDMFHKQKSEFRLAFGSQAKLFNDEVLLYQERGYEPPPAAVYQAILSSGK